MELARLREHLRAIVGPQGVIEPYAARKVYECDGYTLERSVPEIVVLPASTEEVCAVVRLLHRFGVRFVPRGAGTGLSGGCLPLDAPVMIGTGRMRRVLEVDTVNRRILVEAGVANLDVSRTVANFGLHYAPDPSSQAACSIGGNIAENSGGPHTLKYGVTTNHVLGLEIVLPDGQALWLGGWVDDVPGYDLRGFVIGSEGTCGIVTRAILRLTRNPQSWHTALAVFPSVTEATAAVSAIIAAGIVPAAMEMMDHLILRAVEEAYGFGFPMDAGAVLLVELDGHPAGVAAEARAVTALLRQAGASEVRVANSERERAELWKSRKRAFGAVGRLAPNYCTQDGVVPRTRLPEILRRIAAVGQRYGLRIGNVFHAGDGNIHPIILFDERNRDEVERVIAAGREILAACVELGGSLTGEHGIGVEKVQQMPLLFSPQDLLVMRALRQAFDPDERCNPGKIFPTPGGCVEVTRPRRQVPL
ncbi:MAG: lactate dehydrogenase [Candidatus Binatia bacterium]|nr:MAG: lactate dehydrogenase [Candidatus Binatia bacterium]